MAEIKVTYAKLNEAADSISSKTKEFMGVMTEMKSIMSTTSGKWESDAADKFRQQFDKLSANFESYERVLNQYAVYLNKTSAEYVNQDNKVLDQTSVLDNSALLP